jgi:hypothetical protein
MSHMSSRPCSSIRALDGFHAGEVGDRACVPASPPPPRPPPPPPPPPPLPLPRPPPPLPPAVPAGGRVNPLNPSAHAHSLSRPGYRGVHSFPWKLNLNVRSLCTRVPVHTHGMTQVVSGTNGLQC